MNLQAISSSAMAFASTAATYVTPYLTTHHVGNYYCLIIASEASVRAVANLVQSIYFFGAGVFYDVGGNETLADLHSNNFKDSFQSLAFHSTNAFMYGVGALNPLAGIAIPVLFKMRHYEENPEEEDGVNPTDYSTAFLLRPISRQPIAILEEVVSGFKDHVVAQLEFNLGIPKRWAKSVVGIAVIAAGCLVLGVSPSAQLSRV